MNYRSFVGLEIHIQLNTNTKVFCNCKAAFGDEPNTNICPVCTGYPGALPALNEEAMRLSYVVARALNCELSPRCEFERKNYFYPDLPKNYQISQFAAPLGTNGYIDLEFRKKKKRIKIRECHLEEDAGKMIHAGDESLLDFNRAGTPLLEIVTDPDLEIGEEAEHLLQYFRRLVRYLGVCDGNMEEGSMRADANISVNTEGAGLGTKVEIKNMNSFRFVRKALTYEIERQQDILERGGTIVQETRLWNENRDVSESMRVKESSNDYRYFPDPDLPPFRTDQAFLDSVEKSLVELPADRMRRFGSEYALTEAQVQFLCDERPVADFFEDAVAAGATPAEAAVWLMGDVQKLLNRTGATLADSPLSPARLAELLSLLNEGRIHGKLAKQTLAAVFDDDADPAAIIRDRGWEQITDRNELGAIVDEILSANAAAVEQIRGGDNKPYGFLVGQVMKATSGRADPKLVQDVLRQRLALTFVAVLSFGGAITGKLSGDGVVVPGGIDGLVDTAKSDPELPDQIRLSQLDLGEFLSEEITPREWAALIHAIAAHIDTADATGIVVTTGTDTLSYTAALLHWLFGDSQVPIVCAASSSTSESDESIQTFKAAIKTAVGGSPGVSVVFGGERLAAINLKFERVPGGSDEPAFRTWNIRGGIKRPSALLTASDRSAAELTSALESASERAFVAKVFPGMRSSTLISLIDAGVRYFVLELYDSGTANVGDSPFSLREALAYGHERDAIFFCTSQQEGNVDFATYITSHELWREGAIPMGSLTTESVYAKLLAVLLVTESADRETIIRRMEKTE